MYGMAKWVAGTPMRLAAPPDAIDRQLQQQRRVVRQLTERFGPSTNRGRQ
jgi:hypothetical protein